MELITENTCAACNDTLFNALSEGIPNLVGAELIDAGDEFIVYLTHDDGLTLRYAMHEADVLALSQLAHGDPDGPDDDGRELTLLVPKD